MRKVLSYLGSAGCAAQVAGAEGWQSHQASFQSCLTHFCSPGKVSAAVQALGMPGPLLCIATCFPAAIAAALQPGKLQCLLHVLAHSSVCTLQCAAVCVT